MVAVCRSREPTINNRRAAAFHQNPTEQCGMSGSHVCLVLSFTKKVLCCEENVELEDLGTGRHPELGDGTRGVVIN